MSTQETKLTAIANAIRAKDGTSAPIVANDFATRISGIPTGDPDTINLLQYHYIGSDGFNVFKSVKFFNGCAPIAIPSEIPLSVAESNVGTVFQKPALNVVDWRSNSVITDGKMVDTDIFLCLTPIYEPTDGRSHFIVKATSAEPTITLNFIGSGVVNIVWGDGASENLTVNATLTTITHTYSTTGIFDINTSTVSGTPAHGSGGSAAFIAPVANWFSAFLSNEAKFRQYFIASSNVQTLTLAPDTTKGDNLYEFRTGVNLNYLYANHLSFGSDWARGCQYARLLFFSARQNLINQLSVDNNSYCDYIGLPKNKFEALNPVTGGYFQATCKYANDLLKRSLRINSTSTLVSSANVEDIITISCQYIYYGSSAGTSALLSLYNCRKLIFTVETLLSIDVINYLQSCTEIVLPNGWTVNMFSGISFRNAYMLTGIIRVPEGVSTLTAYKFYNVKSLDRVIFPTTLTSITTNVFNASSIKELVFQTTTPPTVSNANAWTSISANTRIYVPDSAVTAYKTATNWTTQASKILPLSEYTGGDL